MQVIFKTIVNHIAIYSYTKTANIKVITIQHVKNILKSDSEENQIEYN